MGSTSTAERREASRTGLGRGTLETETGLRRPVRRFVETPRSRFMSRGYGVDEVEEKGEF